MTMLQPMQKENADEKARRVRLLRIWTDICAMALCEMPEGRSRNVVSLKALAISDHTEFIARVHGESGGCSFEDSVFSDDADAEEKLADIQRRLKPYVA